jgi:hypothetical protein
MNLSIYTPGHELSGGPRTPVDMDGCRAMVQLGDHRMSIFRQCSCKPKVRRKYRGVIYWFCGRHDPVAIQAREDKREAALVARNAERDARYRNREAWAIDRPEEYVAALREIAAGHNNPRQLARKALAKWGEDEVSRMEQIADPRAPFKSIDDAISAGHEYVRRIGASPRGFVAEPQPGGWFVRVVYETPINRGGRAGRKRWQAHTVEVGKIDGPAFHPLDRELLSGRPYLCRTCEKPWGREEDCGSFGCEIEDGAVAQRRLVEAHERAEGATA